MRVAQTDRADSQLTDSRKFVVEQEIVSDVAGRALVVVEPQHHADELTPTHFRDAEFLAQLIATKDQHPQTRVRRRAEPAAAINAYRAVEAMTEFDAE